MRSTGLMNGRLTNASLLAIAAMLAHAPASVQAQSFDAVPTVMAGGAIITVAPNLTTVEVNLPNAVINWVPNAAAGSGPINFQPANTTALFTSLDTQNYAVLNRILPTSAGRPVVFNGTVISQLVNPISGAISRGGTLFFYSPGGIIVGPTGVFNVGNLALTASDVPYNGSTGSFGNLGQFSFLPANAGSAVEIQAGAQITAGPFASYVALVAPKVVNSGTITVDGATVLVAADASTITFRPNGLYDIQIDQGTSATGEVVTNEGTITGPAGTVNSAHRVYMVAVPRNDAITMAIKSGSTLGFDIAQAALVDENAIVLSAGFDVQAGQIAATRQVASPGISAADTDLEIGAINATSQVTGKATGQAALTVAGGSTANFASNLFLSGVSEPGSTGADGAFISVAGLGSVLDINGDLSVRALDAGQVTSAVFSDSGKARIVVDRGSLTVGGTATIDASRAPQVAVDALGGQASLIARNGAAVQIDGDLVLNATGTGKSATDSSPSGPTTGTGGNAKLAFESGAGLTIDGNLTVQASGLGGGSAEFGLAGTTGSGGNAIIEGLAGAGTLTVTGTTLLDAIGVGGDGLYCFSCTIEGGIGSGGGAGITAASGAQFVFGGALTVDASGLGGAATLDGGKDGGGAFGGGTFVISSGGGITANGGILVLAEGRGGLGARNDFGVFGSTGIGGAGGGGTGGSAALAAGDSLAIGGNGTITVAGTTLVSGNGIGGLGYTGAAGQGGSATVSARNGQVSGAGLVVRAAGLGGGGLNGSNGGAGTGGSAEVLALSAIEGAGRVTFGSATLTVLGTGGAGGTPATFFDPGGLGGIGTGGTVRALAEAGNGVLTLAITNVIANGVGGAGGLGGQNFSGPGGVGGVGGIGQGGVAAIGVISGLDTGAINTGLANLGSTTVQASGLGGAGGNGGPGGSIGPDGNGGRGGNAGGGGATVFARGGGVNLSAAAQIVAGALGGSGGLSGSGTAGPGGNAAIGDEGSTPDPRGAQLVVGSRAGHPDQRGTLTGAALSFTAQSQGGSGSAIGTAANLGRPLAFLLDGGSINASSLSFASSGTTASGAPPSEISLAGGNTTLTGTFSFITPGTLTAALSGADLLSNAATISASNWLEGPVPPGSAGTIRGTTSVVFSTGGDLFGNLSAQTDGSLALGAGGRVRLDNLTAAGSISVNAGTTLSLGNLVAGSTVSVTAPGNVSVGTVAAVDDVGLASGAALSAGGITSGQSVQLSGPGSVTLAGDVAAGASIALSSNGAISGRGLSAGLVNPSAVSGVRYDITAVGLGGIGLGAVAAAQDIKLFTPLSVITGALSGREIALLSGGAQSIGSIAANGRVLLADYSMAPIGGDPLGSYDLNALLSAVPIASGGPITVSGATTAGALRVRSTRAIAVRAITTSVAGSANGFVELLAGGTLAGGAIVAAGPVNAVSGGTMDLTSASSGGALTLNAGQALRAGNLTAVDALTVNTNGALVAGDLLGASVSGAAGTSLQVGAVNATGGALALTAAGDLAAGAMAGRGAVSVQSIAGAISTQGIGAGANLSLLAAGNLQTGALDAGGTLDAAGANVALGNVRSVIQLNVTATGAFVTGSVESTQSEVQMFSAGAMRAGAVNAAAAIRLGGLSTISTGDLTAGNAVLVNPDGDVILGAARSRGGTVELRSNNGSLTVGAVSAFTDVALAAANDLAAGDVHARDMLLLAGRNVRTGGLISPDGRILAASNTLVNEGGTIGVYDFNAVFAAVLRATGGTLTVTGPVSGGTFTAAVAGDAALLGATASRRILVEGGGSINLGGVLRAPQIDLSSRDLAMPAGSGLNAGLTGTIRLVSSNADGMRIGDGLDTSILPATSYTLDNAEWSRINSGSLSLFGVDGAGPVDILIGRLDMTGPDAGSTIDDPNGRVLFRSASAPIAPPTGTIRVTGAIRGTGFRATNALVFQTGLFQLSSDTGSINLLGRGGTPLGAVQIEARDIHFAAAPLLARLAADPFFAGAEAALDNERSGASGAVLSAGALGLLAGRTVYIQRTGTGAVPLGFDEPLDGFSVRPAGTDPITVIINGTFRAQAGTVSGVNAWQLFKDSGVDLTRFTPESRLNGCLLNAATCSVISPNPDPGIRTLFDLIDVPASDDPEEAEQQSISPIQAPQPVLAVQPEGLQTQIEEPIAGSGNPALFGSGPNGGLSQ